MDNDNIEKSLKNRKSNLNNCQGENINSISSSIIKQNCKGNIITSENILTTIQINEINIENSTVIGTKLVETDNNDQRYLKAIKQKGEIAILKGENKLIEIIKLKSLEKILKLIGTKLKEFYYDISFGIYSCEEIVELRNNLNIDKNMKKTSIIKDNNHYNFELEPGSKLEKISLCDEIIFNGADKQINFLTRNEKKDVNEDKTKIENKKNIINKENTSSKEGKIEKSMEGNNDNKNMIKNMNEETHNKTNKKDNKNVRKEKHKTLDKVGKGNKSLKIKNKIEEIKKYQRDINKKYKNNQNKKSKQKINQNKISLKNKRQPILTKTNKKISKNAQFLQYTPIKTSINKINNIRNGSTNLKNKKFQSIANYKEKFFSTFKKKIITKSISNINNRKDMKLRTLKSNKYNVNNNNDKMTIKDFYQLNKDRYNNATWNGKNDINNEKNKEIKCQNNNMDIEKTDKIKKCLKCGEIQDINKNKGIYLCENCKGFLCGKCSKMHYLKNPEHKCHYINIQEESIIEKCKSSNNIFKNKSYLSDLPVLKESKSINLINNYKNEKLKSSQINFTKNCKLCNKTLLFNNNSEIIFTNCITCKGNLCESCYDIHLKKNKEHNLVQLMTILMKDNINYDNYLLPKIYCGICRKQKNDFDSIYHCDKCGINLCEDCESEHNTKHPNHNNLLYIRILIKDEINNSNKNEIVCRQCEKNLLENNYACRKCDQCKIYLCLPCGESHLKKYNNHNIIFSILMRSKNQINTSLKSNKYGDNINNDIYNNQYDSSEKRKKEVKIKFKSESLEKFNSNIYEENNNKNKSQVINCIHCNSRINDIYSCNYCFGYLCPSCNKNNTDKNLYILNSFSELNPKFVYKFILNELSEKDNKNKLDICNDCKRDIDKNKEIVYFCIICKSKICNNCVEKHNNDNQEHIIILLKD